MSSGGIVNLNKIPKLCCEGERSWKYASGCRQLLRLSNIIIPITRDCPGEVLWPIQIGGHGAVDRRSLYLKLTLAYDSDHVSGCSWQLCDLRGSPNADSVNIR